MHGEDWTRQQLRGLVDQAEAALAGFLAGRGDRLRRGGAVRGGTSPLSRGLVAPLSMNSIVMPPLPGDRPA